MIGLNRTGPCIKPIYAGSDMTAPGKYIDLANDPSSLTASTAAAGGMTVTGTVTGSPLYAGQQVYVPAQPGLNGDVTITSQVSGTPGGAGVYNLSVEHSARSHQRRCRPMSQRRQDA
jgi:hypothetical protein